MASSGSPPIPNRSIRPFGLVTKRRRPSLAARPVASTSSSPRVSPPEPPVDDPSLDHWAFQHDHHVPPPRGRAREFDASNSLSSALHSNAETPARSPRLRRRSLSLSEVDPPIPRTYASLPPSPVSPVSPPSTPRTSTWDEFIQHRSHPSHSAPFSIWDYLREELLATDFDSHQELKWERVSNFLKIPASLEKIIMFGFVLCLDSFLHTFTILPIRALLALFRLISSTISRSRSRIPPSQKADILRSLLLVLSVIILVPLTDASQIYHFIRGQDTIKLYVIFNALEIADRLCASIGQDIIDCLFSRSTLVLMSHRLPLTTSILRPVFFFTLATFYVVAHALVLVYQLISLNVAVNSYDHALLTLLVSNQFVEIKGSVFKKFEKDNLFQITCADIVERFTLTLMLCAVALRNLIELSGSEYELSEGLVLPKSFGWFSNGNILWTISYPVLAVIFSEVIVDWLKHAFITKFNHIRPSVYERYMDVLCLDLATGSSVISRRGLRKHTYVDQSPVVARRLGFPALPLAVITILIGHQSVKLMLAAHSTANALPLGFDQLQTIKWTVLTLLFWICLVVLKVMMGINLTSYAAQRRMGMEEREMTDAVNDFGRPPIGEGKEEQKYNRDLREMLANDHDDDATPVAEIGEGVYAGRDSKGGKRRLKLEELTRFTMVKRIW